MVCVALSIACAVSTSVAAGASVSCSADSICEAMTPSMETSSSVCWQSNVSGSIGSLSIFELHDPSDGGKQLLIVERFHQPAGSAGLLAKQFPVLRRFGR